MGPFTFIARYFNLEPFQLFDGWKDPVSLNHFSTRTNVQLLGPCFKTGGLKPFCQASSATLMVVLLLCKAPLKKNPPGTKFFKLVPNGTEPSKQKVPRRGTCFEEKKIKILSYSSVWLPKVLIHSKVITHRSRSPRIDATSLRAFWRVDWVKSFDQTHADAPTRQSSAHARNDLFKKPRDKRSHPEGELFRSPEARSLPWLMILRWVNTGSNPFPFNNFKHYLTLFSKFFSPFLRSTCLLSVSHRYLALDEIYHPK